MGPEDSENRAMRRASTLLLITLLPSVGCGFAKSAAAAVLSAGVQAPPYGSYMCADVSGAARSNGTLLQLWRCHGGLNQQFSVMPHNQRTNSSAGGLAIFAMGGTMCLGVPFDPTHLPTAPTQVVLVSCYTYSSDYIPVTDWAYESGQFYSEAIGGCLDAGSGNNGTPLSIRACNVSNSQQWQVK